MPRAKRFTSLLIPCFTPCCCRFVLSPPPSSRFPSIKSNTSATTTHRQEHCPNAADACFCPPDPTSLRTVARVVLLDQETNDYYRNVDSSPPCADCSNIVLCLRSGSRTARRLLISAKSAKFFASRKPTCQAAKQGHQTATLWTANIEDDRGHPWPNHCRI